MLREAFEDGELPLSPEAAAAEAAAEALTLTLTLTLILTSTLALALALALNLALALTRAGGLAGAEEPDRRDARRRAGTHLLFYGWYRPVQHAQRARQVRLARGKG